MNSPHKSSHTKAGLAIGAILGLAAGLYLQSRKGKQLTKDAQKRAVQLQSQVMKKLQGVQEVSKDKYSEIVNHVLDYYSKTREVANTELPEVKEFLMSRWKSIQNTLKESGD